MDKLARDPIRGPPLWAPCLSDGRIQFASRPMKLPAGRWGWGRGAGGRRQVGRDRLRQMALLIGLPRCTEGGPARNWHARGAAVSVTPCPDLTSGLGAASTSHWALPLRARIATNCARSYTNTYTHTHQADGARVTLQQNETDDLASDFRPGLSLNRPQRWRAPPPTSEWLGFRLIRWRQ